MPVIIVLSHIFAATDQQAWQDLVDYKLFAYAKNTILLMLGSGLISLFFGTICAWLTTAYKFPFSKTLEWALVLPLAFPAYISAYMYGGILGIEGSFTAWVSKTFGIAYTNLGFLDILNLPGTIFVVTSVLYPYVYLSVKASLKQMSQSSVDAARVYGYSPTKIFFKIVLPSQRLAIVAGVSLVMMEAMSDFGVVSYFGVDTFVNGIFSTWFGRGDLQLATKLASMLMIFVFILLFLEKMQRKGKNYSSVPKGFRPLEQVKLSGFGSLFAFIICFIPFLLGFLVPGWRMVDWFLLTYMDVVNEEYITLTLNTFKLALIATIVATIVGFILVYITQLYKSKTNSILLQISKLGYAVPGAVIGVGILTLFGFLRKIDDNISFLFVGGSVVGLIFGYCVRFLAVSASSFESGYGTMNKNYKDAGKVMGYSWYEILKKIDIPLLKGAFGASLLIVFVEILKELPLTLILRPFNFETLSSKAQDFTIQEMMIQSAVPSVCIVLLSIIPVILLIKTTLRR